MARTADTYRANGRPGVHTLIGDYPNDKGLTVRMKIPNAPRGAFMSELAKKILARCEDRESRDRWGGRGDPARLASVLKLRADQAVQAINAEEADNAANSADEARKEKKRAADRARRARAKAAKETQSC
jgi:hypothetical protein